MRPLANTNIFVCNNGWRSRFSKHIFEFNLQMNADTRTQGNPVVIVCQTVWALSTVSLSAPRPSGGVTPRILDWRCSVNSKVTFHCRQYGHIRFVISIVIVARSATTNMPISNLVIWQVISEYRKTYGDEELPEFLRWTFVCYVVHPAFLTFF